MIRHRVSALVVSVVALSCGGGSDSGGSTAPAPAPTPTPVLTTLSVTLNSASISVNGSTTASAAGADQNGNPIATGTVSWATSSPSVATVSASGVVTGVSAGLTDVIATAGGKTGQRSVTVTPAVVASVSIAPASATIALGGTVQLTATAKDATGAALTGRTITWSSSNTAVASVSNLGVVSSLSPGKTSVSATVEGATASLEVTVSPVALDFNRAVTGSAATLSARLASVDLAARTAVINGVETRPLAAPFTFAWGDGSVTTGYFPQTHVYADAARNRVVRVTARYSASETDSTDVLVRFVAPSITATAYPPAVGVTIPATVPTFASRLPGVQPSPGLRPLDESFFGSTLPRSTVEYVLSQGARALATLLENDIELVNGGWQQVVVQDPGFGGGYSLWYSTPITLVLNASFFQGSPDYSSLFHEMAHNLSLNSPAAFPYGPRVGGPANAIYSEAVAQILAHTVAFEMVNNAASYGLPWDLALDIASKARGSAAGIRQAFDEWVSAGKPVATWNDPGTSVDETFGTFMAVARQFILHAEQAKSYGPPATRVMRLLRTFNAAKLTQYAPQSNTVAANTYRATLLVAALSYGFQQDLRGEFRALNFPIDDAVYQSLLAGVP